MKIAYMAGPGNVRGALQLMEDGEDDVGLSHVGYSSQMLRAAARVGAREVLMFTDGVHNGPEQDRSIFDIWGMRVGVVQLKNHYEGKSGARFHLASLSQARAMRRVLREFKPDVLIASDEPNRAAALEFARTEGCTTVRVHHCSIWPWLKPVTLKQTALNIADHAFPPDVAMSASRVVSNQLRMLYGQRMPIAEFLPSFDEQLHLRITPLPETPGELHVAFIGRVETYKGVMDVARAASWLRMAQQRVFFHVCGDGDAMPELQRYISERNLQDRVFTYGRCDRIEMQDVMRRCHIGIAPTRSEFGEGFCQAAVEYVLNGRPVLGSPAIPGLPYIAEAAWSIPAADSVLYYCAALTTLLHDPQKIDRMHKACRKTVEKFFDAGSSYEAAMIHVLNSVNRDLCVLPANRYLSFEGAPYATVEEAEAPHAPAEKAA